MPGRQTCMISAAAASLHQMEICTIPTTTAERSEFVAIAVHSLRRIGYTGSFKNISCHKDKVKKVHVAVYNLDLKSFFLISLLLASSYGNLGVSKGILVFFNH